MLFKATLWTRELSLKKSTGILTYPHQTVMDQKNPRKNQKLPSRFPTRLGETRQRTGYLRKARKMASTFSLASPNNMKVLSL
jgi:hypothetical protein